MENDGKKNETALLSWAATLGIHLVLTTAAGAAAGYFLDRWLHCSPWCLFAGFFIGVLAGFREIFKHAGKQDNEKR